MFLRTITKCPRLVYKKALSFLFAGSRDAHLESNPFRLVQHMARLSPELHKSKFAYKNPKIIETMNIVFFSISYWLYIKFFSCLFFKEKVLFFPQSVISVKLCIGIPINPDKLVRWAETAKRAA